MQLLSCRDRSAKPWFSFFQHNRLSSYLIFDQLLNDALRWFGLPTPRLWLPSRKGQRQHDRVVASSRAPRRDTESDLFRASEKFHRRCTKVPAADPILGFLAIAPTPRCPQRHRLTCMRLHQVSLPLLYHRVNAQIYLSARFVRLIRHFSRLPNYGELVRELSVFGLNAFTRVYPSYMCFYFEEARRRGIRVLPHEGNTSNTVAALRLALILHQTPNIQKLSIRTPVSWENSPDMKFASRLPDSFMLDSLRHLEVRPFNIESALDWDTIDVPRK